MATVLKRPSAGAAAALAAMLVTGAATADDVLGSARSTDAAAVGDTPKTPAPTSRRGGFTVGADLGAGVASIVGYPNDVKKIGYIGYYTVTGVRPSVLGELWLGGAFTDWFTFSIGATASPVLATGENRAQSFGGMFHIEVFPLFLLGGHLRDLGVRLDAGLGMATVRDASGVRLVDSTLASMIGGGVFYEGLRLGKTAHGPFLMGNYLWSETALRPAIFLGWRSVLYTKP
jgi:hypothetical protein